jgi:hypothetical protein
MAIEIIEHLSDKQIEDVRQLYTAQHTEKQSPDVKRLLKNTSLVVAMRDLDAKKIMAFSRVLTDYVRVALILDLMVDPAYRSREIERLLLETILHHPKLISVAAFETICGPDQLSSFAAAGFTARGDVHHLHRPGDDEPRTI